MKLSTLRRSRRKLSQASRPWRGSTGVPRTSPSGSNPGEIAVVDHLDMDRAAAVALVDAGVVAVVNAAPSISGRYPNLGPRSSSSTPA